MPKERDISVADVKKIRDLLRALRTHQRGRVGREPRQFFGVPGNVVRAVAHEVDDVQLLPEALARLGRDAVPDQCAGFFFAALQRVRDRRLGGFAREARTRRTVEGFKELRLPLGPDLGARRADVGDGEKVEGVEAVLAAGELHEALDHRRVGDVLALRDAAHREVFAHEKFDEVGVFLREAVVDAEAPHLLGADLFVAAAEALSDVVKERRDAHAPALGNLRHHLRAEGVLVREVAAAEAPDVAHGAKRMLVDREDVVEVVLHLPDDVPEGFEKASEQTGSFNIYHT